MASRSRAWMRIYARAIRMRAGRFARKTSESPRRILLPHYSRLGDTILLTATVAKARECFPEAEIVHVMPKAFVPLFAKRPYRVTALGWNPAEPDSLKSLFDQESFDIALINGDARYSWLAAAMGAHRIIAFEGDRPAYKSWPVDHFVSMPSTPMSWSDLVTTLLPGAPPTPFQPGIWGAPDCAAFERPRSPYAVLHVGASHTHKTWDSENWAALARGVERRGLTIVWSAGPNEEPLVQAIPGSAQYQSYAGRLSLTQLWNLLASAELIVTPDTSVAHLGRAVFTPTVTLFGPSGPLLGGLGMFWRNCPASDVSVDPFPCRDQNLLFKRAVPWVRRCTRGLHECPSARCMQAISVGDVEYAVDRLLEEQ